MPECLNCGRFVTRQFTRVFGDNDGTVRGCTACKTQTELNSGVAAFASGVDSD